MMLNKNVKTEGNPTLLKIQYGQRRVSRTDVQLCDSGAPDGRRKSVLNIKHSHVDLGDNDDSNHNKNETRSDLYSKNPQLSRASLNLNKKNSFCDADGNLQQKSFERTMSTDDVTNVAFDPEKNFDFDADDEDPSSFHKPDSTVQSLGVTEDHYCRICKSQGVLPSSKFQRQLKSPVADMSNSLLGTKDIKSISIALTSNLKIKDLDLSGNDLGDKGATYLSEGLKENVSVDDLNISECNICLDGLKAICALFLDMKPMKRLSLARNKFEKKHAELIAQVIQKNDYIEDLDLSGNEFNEDGGALIGQALGSNVGIKRLDLSWNHIRRGGATAVCEALRLNRTIEELDLSWNGLAEEGCRALQKSLPPNHTLRELDLTCNRINVFSLRYLLDGVEKNDTLKILLIDKNPITTDGAILMLKVLKKSETSVISSVHMEDVPVNDEFLDILAELKGKKNVNVHHRNAKRKKITPIIMDRTLKDFDPALVLFEYMKQENLRLLDLFRAFDTDADHAVSRTELKEGFVAINLPLSDEAVDSLFDRMDLNDNHQIEYDEYKVGYRKTMNRIQRNAIDEDDKNIDTITQLRSLIKKAIKESREMPRQDSQRRTQSKFQRSSSITALLKQSR